MKVPISERRKQIAQRTLEQGYISVREMADFYEVSTETIRKDLLDLEKKNIISKGHGDAIISSTYQENPFNQKVTARADIKTRIAERGVSMIPEEGIVMLDSGSTVMQAAKLLNLKAGLTVITNSLSSAQALAGTENQLLLIGGELRGKSLSLVGSWAANNLSCVRADIALMGCDGFHENGPCIHSYRELEIKQMMVSNASQVVLLCDSSKIGSRGLYSFANFNQFNCMVTDSGITEEQKQLLSNKLELIIV